MKIMQFAAALLLGVSLSAHSTPVQYNFSSNWSFEYDFSSGGIATNPIFAASDTFNGSFIYDSETPLLPTVSQSALYPGALTSLTGSLAGHDYSLASALGSVNQTNDIITFGGFSYMLTIGEWQSDSFSLIWFDSAVLGGDVDINSPNLPTTLPPPGFVPAEAQFSVNFVNTNTAARRQVSFRATEIVSAPPAQVPEPGSLALLIIGAAMLTVATRPKSTAGFRRA